MKKHKKPSCCRFIIYVIIIMIISEICRKVFYGTNDCKAKYYSEIFLVAKREMFLNQKEHAMYKIIEETLEELVKLQLVLDFKNGSVIHKTYDKLQKFSVQMNSSIKESYIENSDDHKEVVIPPNNELKDERSFLKDKVSNKSLSLSTNSNETIYSCNEFYNGSLFGYPSYTKGFVREKCKRIPFSKSVSLILDRPVMDTRYLQTILDKTRNMFKYIYLVVNRKEMGTLSKILLWDNIKVHLFQHGYKELGLVLNSVIKHVSSHFVLIASHISEFTIGEEGVERLVSAYIKTEAHAVGASIKNIYTGEWDRNCYQSKLKLYTLKYTEGYDLSSHECLRCDYMNGSFLTSLSNLQSVRFNKNLTTGVYDDFFLRLKMLDANVYVCPDIMFYGYYTKLSNHRLARFSKGWDIKKIIYPDRSVFWFGCRAGHRHTSKTRCPFHKGMSVPPCCLENLKDSIDFLFSQCNSNGIMCELQEGSVLGMVKFHGVLPWERDADVKVFSEDIHKLQELTDIFKKQSYDIVTDEMPNGLKGGILHIRAHGWSIQIYGYNNVTRREKRINTKMKMKNEWINVPENPGEYSRNRYGNEMYKHVEHWMTLNHKSGWDTYMSGKFSKCAIPGHHACLDQFIADGDNRFTKI